MPNIFLCFYDSCSLVGKIDIKQPHRYIDFTEKSMATKGRGKMDGGDGCQTVNEC